MILQRTTFVILLALLLLASIGGCSTSTPAEAASGNSTAFICTETKEVFAADKLTSTNINPKTGRATLVPALYCSHCQKWHPSPPLETLQRKPGASLCPIDKTPMSVSGPSPITSTN